MEGGGPAVDFLFVGGRLEVDLLNTRVVDQGRPRELLTGWPALVAWAEAAGVVRQGELRGRGPTGETASLRRLREQLRRHLGTWARRKRASAPLIRLVNRHLVREPSLEALAVRQGVPRLDRRRAAPPLERLYAAIARSTAELLVHGDPARLRRCAGRGCVLTFYDGSRGGGRRWCSMATCGTRAKVRAHYWRHRG